MIPVDGQTTLRNQPAQFTMGNLLREARSISTSEEVATLILRMRDIFDALEKDLILGTERVNSSVGRKREIHGKSFLGISAAIAA